MRRVLLCLAVAAAAAFASTPANAACTDPNLDCLLIECGPRIDDQGRIDYVPC